MLKQTVPLRRSGPLRRRKRLNAKRAKPRRSSRVLDRGYLEKVRDLECIAWMPECYGPIEAHHASVDHGKGQKGSDYCAVPLCRRHHRQWTDHTGWFKDWTKDGRREMSAQWIARTQARLGLAAPSPEVSE